ncbi:MAG: hypothetical protein ONB16_10635 [candidate division KSB1 bacterium]|nr:hypothetical protein [candidate division KSB1 bacterium]
MTESFATPGMPKELLEKFTIMRSALLCGLCATALSVPSPNFLLFFICFVAEDGCNRIVRDK